VKADRRADGQRREHRNDRPKSDRSGQQRSSEPRSDRQPQRHPHRADGHAAHRPDGGQQKRRFDGRRRPSGQRRAG
jgi:hypothetical protein